MSDVFLGRQPIIDREQEVYGYELLYRARDGAWPSSGDAATARVAINTCLELGFERVVGPKFAFVNMTRDFLLSGYYRILPRERAVLEVLEDIQPERSVFEALEAAREAGYRIALDDFVPGGPQEEFLPLADIVKVETPQLDEAGARKLARRLARPGLVLLAEKVETPEEFELYFDAGYDLFQGYFFAKPRLVEGRALPTDRVSLIQLLAMLRDPDVDVENIELLVERNLGISYKLLRLVNSALVALPAKIASIRHAIMMLGLERVRNCVTLLILSGVDDKPHELITTALVRARTCQLLAPPDEDQTYFTAGLLSALDAFLDRDLASVLKEISISDELRGALLEHSGPSGEALEVAIACEQADWDRVTASPLGPERIQEAYVQALTWSLEAESVLGSVQLDPLTS